MGPVRQNPIQYEVTHDVSNSGNFDDLERHSRSCTECRSCHMRLFIQSCSRWQDFNYHSTSRGPSVTTEPLVDFWRRYRNQVKYCIRREEIRTGMEQPEGRKREVRSGKENGRYWREGQGKGRQWKTRGREELTFIFWRGKNADLTIFLILWASDTSA